MIRSHALTAAVLILLVPTVAVACLWDYDTIKMERSRFPETLELITGKFLRHSPEFYEWRVENRQRRLQAEPSNVALLDDLSVAYDKLGKHDQAIATALSIEKIAPGRYETAANLGSFYLHSGRMQEGIREIDRALQINPDAHFGREKYQKLLAEYVLKRRQKKATFPLSVDPGINRGLDTAEHTFSRFLYPENEARGTPQQTYEPAIKGVLGMMKFGNHASPVLLEALGSLLYLNHGEHREWDAKMLAGRAFLKASYEVEDKAAKEAYRTMAQAAISMQSESRDLQRSLELEKLEADFQRELADANAWYDDLRQKETQWIQEGKDPEAEFDRLYQAAPALPGMEVSDPLLSSDQRLVAVLVGVGITLVAVVLGVIAGGIYLFIRFARRRSQPDLPA